MREFNSTFNEKIFKFAVNDFAKNINFAINKVKTVEVVFDGLFIFVIIIAINEYNDIILFDCEHTTLFVYYVINNQIEFDYFRIIKYMNLNINYHKDIVNFVEFYEKKLNKIKFR